MMARLVEFAAVFGALVAAVPSPDSLRSDLNLLIDNDLQGVDSPSANSGIIMLDARPLDQAASACEALGEELWSPDLNPSSSIQPNLDFLKLQRKADSRTKFWIAPKGKNALVLGVDGNVSSSRSSSKLPVLCTQTAPFSYDGDQDTDEKWQVQIESNNETYVGFRDRLSFRFLGLRYAPQPERFTYSEPYEGSGQTVDATKYGSQCMQGGSGSEDCLFLNIWTSFLPKSSRRCSKEDLKPVMFWIHGGAFTGGTGNDPTVDGGNIVSRGDVVLVAINYRLANLGFLALDDGVTNGNFGFADQINALDWVRRNIADFGGDPDQITIFGQSAGAGSVRGMMESSEALGKFARAIPLSNLGGINYGTTYSKYYTIEQEMQVAGNSILSLTNCTNAASQVDCLRKIDAVTLTTLSTTARYMVVDGKYITHDELQLVDGTKAPYDLMMGTTRDDGGPFISYPTTTNEAAYLNASGFAVPPADLFPIPDMENKTYALYNMTTRLATDGIFRCIDEATVKAGLSSGKFAPEVYYYEFNRTYQTTGWPMTSVCEPPKTVDHPYGDPNMEYFKCHSGELYYVFGNLARQKLPMRDGNDLPFEQFVLDTFAAFARTGDPNPDERFLGARGYASTLGELREVGEWKAARDGELTMRVLQWPSFQTGFREGEQCDALGLGIDYYLEGN